MKTSLMHLASAAALFATLSSPALSAAPTKLAGIELGMKLDEVKAAVEKNFPDYVHVVHETEEFGVPYTMHAWRKLNPDAEHYYSQELESIVVTTLEDGSVFQIGRAQSVEPGAMNESTLVAAAKENFGEPTARHRDTYQWHSDDDCSNNISTTEVGRPGMPYSRGKRFNMEKDVYLKTRLFQEYEPSCQRRAELLVQSGPSRVVSFYATTLVDTAAFMERYNANQEPPAEAGSVKPAF